VKQKHPMVRLFGYVRPYRGKLVLAFVCMAFYAVFNGLLPFATITVANTIQEKTGHKEVAVVGGGEPAGAAQVLPKTPVKADRLDVIRRFTQRVFKIEKWTVGHLAAAILFVIFFKGLFEFSQRFLMEWVGKRVVMDVRNRLYGHFHTLSINFFSGARTGELISRITNDVLVVEQSISQVIADVFRQPVIIVFMLGVIAYINWKLAIIVFVIFPLIFIPILSLGRRIRRSAGKIQSLLANLTAIIQETFSGIRVVRAFGMEKYETEKFERENRGVFDTSIKLLRALSLVRPTIEFVGGASVAATLVLGAYVFGMGLPHIMGFCAGVFLLYDPVKKLGQVNNRLQVGTAAAERVFAILDTQPDIVESPGAIPLARMKEGLSYNGVSFAYDNDPVLQDVSFEVKPGQIVAIVGRSGAGKTTLVNLLLRFYDPAQGSIRIDGVDLRDAKLSSLRQQTAIVSQEVVLFNDTVTANIAYGRPETPFSAVIEAAKAANAHDFTSALPEGYDTLVGERGIKLSGGQRQRIAIARAILKDPAILILDEATSALDTEAERLVQGAINRLMSGRTVLVIAHRLSTIINADTIVVLDGGRVLQKGNHRQLIEAGGLYKKLYDMQFKDV
jgi:subfamily B ATP-binding cassette protein MsbA